ncbi:MAG: RNA-binding protein [Pseudomonadota bacterium]
MDDPMERMCIVTKERGGPDTLIRFVLDPEAIVVPDLKANLPGRGAWVKAHRSVLEKAVEKGLFSRAFKAKIAPGGTDGLVERTELVLRRHGLGALGLARKAGLVLTGFSKVEGAVKNGAACALLHADMAGRDGRQKLDRLAKHLAVPIFCVFTEDEMGFSLGREHVVHAALVKGSGAPHFVEAFQRLDTFLTR